MSSQQPLAPWHWRALTRLPSVLLSRDPNPYSHPLLCRLQVPVSADVQHDSPQSAATTRLAAAAGSSSGSNPFHHHQQQQQQQQSAAHVQWP
jgi:hypothetical protein